MKIAGNRGITMACTAGLICLVVYLRALSCGFVNWDDPEYVLEKAAIRQLDMNLVISAFTQPLVVLWKPLTFISYALDFRVWGLNPLGYHLTNILLHAVNTGLVVLISGRLLQGTGAARQQKGYLYSAMLLAGVLWGLHPLRVESVAWVSGRKDVLNGVFTLGSMFCYLRYAQKKDDNVIHGWRGDYVLSLVFFLCSLLAKPVSVVLPVMMLVADWYPLERFRTGNRCQVFIEKLPFLMLSAAITAITLSLAIHRGNLFISSGTLSFGQKVLMSGNAMFEYLRLMVFPAGIQPLYLIPTPIPHSYYVKTAAVAAICICLLAVRKKKWLSATWLCFLIPLVPVLAVFQISASAFAARYTYLPSIVPSIAAAAGIVLLFKTCVAGAGRSAQFSMVALVASLPVVHGVMTYGLIGTWRDSLSLWSDAVAKDPNNYAAWDALGGVYRAAGKPDQARQAYERGLAGKPASGDLLYGLGDLYTESGELDKGHALLKKLLELHPAYVMGWVSLGNNYRARGNYAGAEKAYKQAQILQPEALQVVALLGDLARMQMHLDQARDYYRQVEAGEGEDPENAYRMVCVESLAGRPDEALTWLEKAFQRGYRDLEKITTDTELGRLREDPRFRILLQRYVPELRLK